MSEDRRSFRLSRFLSAMREHCVGTCAILGKEAAMENSGRMGKVAAGSVGCVERLFHCPASGEPIQWMEGL